MSGDQTARLLALVPYLQGHQGASLDETAAIFHITPGQLRRDLDVLYMCGLPGLMPGDMIDVDLEAVDGDGRIFLTNAGYLGRPLRFSRDEALGLVLALGTLADLADSGTGAAARSALAKLRSALGAQADTGVSVAGAEALVRDSLTDAIRRRVRVRLAYDGRDRSTRPVVEPARLFARDGFGYLQAFSLERDAWRYYRLDRIAAAEALPDAATTREVPDVGSGPWSERLAYTAEATLLLAPAARWVTEYFPTRSVEELPDGWVRARFGVVDDGWLTALLLRLGEHARVVEPADAAGPARERARAALERYAALAEG